MSNNPTWLQRLKQHYSAPLAQSFKQFKLGAMLFFFGGMLIYASAAAMTASALQEVVLLAGLFIGGFGFLIAMMAQVRMMISRLVKFFSD
ncbi:hypothetical protein KOI40_06845 [Aestuariicella sp. G3-2]|uniref:hypothetical protein n=1 Tax=Pseudomaricurvus albidus TaxID=2842452 RepID=UPI001C0AEB13|nr:hypothetical protein [Aestuariicella albida]MBU3069533.1 hypothetical protein [Aestuariicella albida]